MWAARAARPVKNVPTKPGSPFARNAVALASITTPNPRHGRKPPVCEWFTVQNPRRHAAGKPFHAFLTGWLGQGLASLRFRENNVSTVRGKRHLAQARFSTFPRREYTVLATVSRSYPVLKGTFPRATQGHQSPQGIGACTFLRLASLIPRRRCRPGLPWAREALLWQPGLPPSSW